MAASFESMTTLGRSRRRDGSASGAQTFGSRLARSTPREVRDDISDQRAKADSTEPTDPTEPTDSTDNAEPMLPIEANDPTLPIDSIEPLL
jgi:hypothetical protein